MMNKLANDIAAAVMYKLAALANDAGMEKTAISRELLEAAKASRHNNIEKFRQLMSGIKTYSNPYSDHGMAFYRNLTYPEKKYFRSQYKASRDAYDQAFKDGGTPVGAVIGKKLNQFFESGDKLGPFGKNGRPIGNSTDAEIVYENMIGKKRWADVDEMLERADPYSPYYKKGIYNF